MAEAEAEAEAESEAEGHHHTYNCTVFAAVAAVCILLFRIFDFPQLCSQT